MSEFLPFLIIFIIATVLVRNSQRRQRTRNELRWKNPNSIVGRTPPPEIDDSDAQTGDLPEAERRRATTTQIADALTTVLRSDHSQAPSPPPPAPQLSSDASHSISDRDREPAAIGASIPKTPDAPLGQGADGARSTSPIFVDVDPATMDPTISAAMADANSLRAARSMRNASLNGIDGSDLALGMLYWKMGRSDEAEGILRNIARTDAVAANNLAAILETRGHLREAMPFYHRAAQAGDSTAIENVERLEG